MDQGEVSRGPVMVCSRCHAENPSNNRFCGNCGAALGVTAKPATMGVVTKESKKSPLRRWLLFVALGLVAACVFLGAIVSVFDTDEEQATPAAIDNTGEVLDGAVAAATAPTDSSKPSATPSLSDSPEPSNTPTPKPTKTPPPTRTPRPTNTPKPTRTPTSTPRPTATTEPYDVWKSSAEAITYKMVDKSDEYIGQRVCWSGKVFNIEETLGITFFQAWYEDTLDAFVVYFDGALPDVFKDTRVEVCGLIDEKFEGTNAYGATIEQPQIQAVHVVPPKPKPASKPQPTATPTTPPVLAKLGEQVKAGNWLFAVTEVQYHKALYFYDEAKVAMGVYCVLFIEIQNQAPGTTHFGELWWELHGAGGKVYDDDGATFRAAWQFGGKDTHFEDLNPGQTAQIVIVFDVAQDAKGLQLYSYQLQRPFVLIGDAQPPQDQSG